MKWETVKLEECCYSISDGDHQPPPKAESGIPFVTISNITDTNRFDFDNTAFVSKEYYDNLDTKRKAQAGDILYSVVGSFGIPILIKETVPFVFQRHIAILKPNTAIVDPRFLYYTMLSREFFAKADAVAMGTAQRTIGLAALRKIMIALPAVSIQHKISDILSSYDNLIENNQKQIALLEETAQRLYREWFIDLRFPGYEDVPVVNGVPKGWAIRALSEVFTYIRGKSYSSEELSDADGTLMVNLKNIRPYGGYNRNAEKRFVGQYKDDQSLEPGDIVMGVTDMTQERRLAGYTAIVPNLNESMTFSMDLIKLLPLTVDKSYLYSVMQYGGYSKIISQLANGVNVLHLKPEVMMNMNVLVPSNRVMKMYDALFKQYQEKVELLQKQCNIAFEARDRLLPKLMSGELEV